jgi:hypothetical protein
VGVVEDEVGYGTAVRVGEAPTGESVQRGACSGPHGSQVQVRLAACDPIGAEGCSLCSSPRHSQRDRRCCTCRPGDQVNTIDKVTG